MQKQKAKEIKKKKIGEVIVKNFHRVEVISKIEWIKIIDDENYEDTKTISINNWALVPMFLHDNTLYIEQVEEEEKIKYEKIMQKKQEQLSKEWKKLSTKDMTEAYNNMPKFLEKIELLYINDKQEIKNFVKDIIVWII